MARATEPALAAIKLAWWRERLEELDEGTIPAEPRLGAVAAQLLPRGIHGADLADLTEGWAAMLDEKPDAQRIAEGGARLFTIGGKLLGANEPLIEPAGRLYGTVHAARHGLAAIEAGKGEFQQLSGLRSPKPLRPLTALAALAARDVRRPPPFEPEATPGRSWALIRHRLTGKI